MSWVGVITNAGRTAINEVLEQGTALNINAAQTGSGTVPEANMRAATALKTPVGAALVKQKRQTDAGVEIRVEVQPAAAAYVLKEIGIFGVIGGNTMLLGLWQNADGIEVPSAASFPDYRYILSAVLDIDNLEEMTVTPNMGAYVGVFQGLEHAGKYLIVGEDGYVRPTTVPDAEGASF